MLMWAYTSVHFLLYTHLMTHGNSNRIHRVSLIDLNVNDLNLLIHSFKLSVLEGKNVILKQFYSPVFNCKLIARI